MFSLKNIRVFDQKHRCFSKKNRMDYKLLINNKKIRFDAVSDEEECRQ